jgi:hypothetical protein
VTGARVAASPFRALPVQSEDHQMALPIAETIRPPSPWGTALLDAGSLLGLVWAVPLAVLIVGGPIALAIALVLWIGRLMSGGF